MRERDDRNLSQPDAERDVNHEPGVASREVRRERTIPLPDENRPLDVTADVEDATPADADRPAGE